MKMLAAFFLSIAICFPVWAQSPTAPDITQKFNRSIECMKLTKEIAEEFDEAFDILFTSERTIEVNGSKVTIVQNVSISKTKKVLFVTEFFVEFKSFCILSKISNPKTNEELKEQKT